MLFIWHSLKVTIVNPDEVTVFDWHWPFVDPIPKLLTDIHSRWLGDSHSFRYDDRYKSISPVTSIVELCPHLFTFYPVPQPVGIPLPLDGGSSGRYAVCFVDSFVLIRSFLNSPGTPCCGDPGHCWRHSSDSVVGIVEIPSDPGIPDSTPDDDRWPSILRWWFPFDSIARAFRREIFLFIVVIVHLMVFGIVVVVVTERWLTIGDSCSVLFGIHSGYSIPSLTLLFPIGRICCWHCCCWSDICWVLTLSWPNFDSIVDDHLLLILFGIRSRWPFIVDVVMIDLFSSSLSSTLICW